MADRSIAAGDTLNKFRFEFNGTAEDIGDISVLQGTSGIIAAATDVVEAVVLLNPDLTTISTDNHVFSGGSIIFEGATEDSFETTLEVTDPTADRTFTLPNHDGTVMLIEGAQTMTNKTLTSPTLTSPVLNTAVSGTAILDEDDITNILNNPFIIIGYNHFKCPFTSAWDNYCTSLLCNYKLDECSE